MVCSVSIEIFGAIEIQRPLGHSPLTCTHTQHMADKDGLHRIHFKNIELADNLLNLLHTYEPKATYPHTSQERYDPL